MARYVLPPRQKMINLLYIILIAMLAINVSTDVLTGYDVILDGYDRKIEKMKSENRFLLEEIEREFPGNETTVDNDFLQMSRNTNLEAGRLMDQINEIKADIARQADGGDYIEGKLDNREDLSAVPLVVLSSGKGNALENSITEFRNYVLPYLKNPSEKELVSQYLETKADAGGFSWNQVFESLPAVGGLVFFSRLQVDVLQSEHLFYRSLLNDIRHGREQELLLKDSLYRAYLEKEKQKELLPPKASVSAAWMNILYAGIDNPLDITTYAMQSGELQVGISHGTVSLINGIWYVRPLAGKPESTVVLSNVSNGVKKEIGRYDFKIIPVPDPSPFIKYKNEKGENLSYKGSVPVEKRYLLNFESMKASYQNEQIDILFEVSEFEVILVRADNTTLYASCKGSGFGEKEKEIFRQASKGDRLYVTSIFVNGPDGKKREIRPVEIVVK